MNKNLHQSETSVRFDLQFWIDLRGCETLSAFFALTCRDMRRRPSQPWSWCRSTSGRKRGEGKIWPDRGPEDGAGKWRHRYGQTSSEEMFRFLWTLPTSPPSRSTACTSTPWCRLKLPATGTKKNIESSICGYLISNWKLGKTSIFRLKSSIYKILDWSYRDSRPKL